MRTIFIIMIGLSGFILAQEAVETGIVIDSTTGLVWQDNSENNTTEYTWQEAIDYCEGLSLAGDDDWRLPNINEFKTIIDRSKIELAIVDGFEYIGVDNSYIYWSSSSFLNDENDEAWVVFFNNGIVSKELKDESGYVRCVRAGE